MMQISLYSISFPYFLIITAVSHQEVLFLRRGRARILHCAGKIVFLKVTRRIIFKTGFPALVGCYGLHAEKQGKE